LQPLPTAVRQRLFDGHFRAQQCDNNHWRHPAVLKRPGNHEGVFAFDLAADARE